MKKTISLLLFTLFSLIMTDSTNLSASHFSDKTIILEGKFDGMTETLDFSQTYPDLENLTLKFDSISIDKLDGIEGDLGLSNNTNLKSMYLDMNAQNNGKILSLTHLYLPNLETLAIFDSYPIRIDFINHFPNLKKLQFSGNPMASLTTASKLSHLEELSFINSFYKLGDQNISNFGKAFYNLKKLNISYGRIFTNFGDPICNNENLKIPLQAVLPNTEISVDIQCIFKDIIPEW